MLEYTNIEMIGDKTNVRYALYKWGMRNVFVIGLNPSTASDEKPDPTMKRVMGFVENFPADGFVMMNLYPQRATNPDDLHQQADPELMEENIRVFKQMLEENAKRFHHTWILLAFGANIVRHRYMIEMLQQMYEAAEPYHPHWCSLGTTQAGHPKHPLYLKSDQRHWPFDMEPYLAMLEEELRKSENLTTPPQEILPEEIRLQVVISNAGAHDIIRALDVLHKRGYEQLRLLPGVSPNGSCWRWHIYPRCLMQGIPDMERNGNDYCPIEEDHPVGSTGQSGHRVSASELADAMLALYGDTLRLGRLPDEEYVSWYKQIVAAARRGELPVAYADGAYAHNGWWLGKSVIPNPPFERLGECVLRAEVAGIGWSDADDVAWMMKRGAELCMVREANNPHDKNAVALYYANTKLGYVPRACNKELAEKLDQHFGCFFSARVTWIKMEEPHFPKISFAVYKIETPVVLDFVPDFPVAYGPPPVTNG